VEPEPRSESLEKLVDDLLRDNDYLLAQELKQRVDELNALLKQASKQGLRLTLRTGRKEKHDAADSTEFESAWLELKVFKEI